MVIIIEHRKIQSVLVFPSLPVHFPSALKSQFTPKRKRFILHSLMLFMTHMSFSFAETKELHFNVQGKHSEQQAVKLQNSSVNHFFNAIQYPFSDQVHFVNTVLVCTTVIIFLFSYLYLKI